MKLKRFLAGVGVFCFSALLVPSAQACAEEPSGSTTTIRTTVPDTHTVLLDIGEHGSVIINGKAYTSKEKEVLVSRLAEQSYTIEAEKGWQVDMVAYALKAKLVNIELKGNTFTAPAINSNENKLTVRFKQQSASGNAGSHEQSGNTGTGVQTGDNANIILFCGLLIFSGTVIALINKKKIHAVCDWAKQQ